MAGDKGDQGSKEEIAEGMSEAGKGQVKGGGEAGKAGPRRRSGQADRGQLGNRDDPQLPVAKPG
jgi:hypothetical protein